MRFCKGKGSTGQVKNVTRPPERHPARAVEVLERRFRVNKYCFRNCAYNDICNINEENTALCKVADDKDAQDFKRSTIMGIPTNDLLAMQYKNKKD